MTSVMYVANAAKIGGGNRVLMDLVGGLDRSRFRPTLVSPARGPLVEWAEREQIPCAVIGGNDCEGRFQTWRRAVPIAWLMRRWRTDIVHATSYTCFRAASLAARFSGTPRICHLGFPPTAEELRWNFSSGAECVVACYEEQRRDVASVLAEVQPACEVRTICNGIDTNRFRPGGGAMADASLRDGADHVVVIVGHLSDVKGYPTFVRAAATISAVLPRCRFLLVGGDTLGQGWQPRLERLAEELGIRESVRFLGWQDDIRPVLDAADVMALPSRAEGLPLAILEAMSLAKPVVASAVNGIPDAVVDGETGYLVRPDDDVGLADRLLQVMRDPEHARKLGEAGRRRIETHFSVTTLIAGFETLYGELVA